MSYRNSSPEVDVTAALREQSRSRVVPLPGRLGRVTGRWLRWALLACFLLGTPAAYALLHGYLHLDPSIRGTVLDLQGRPVAGVRVSLKGGDTCADTDEEGRFHLEDVPPGRAWVVVEAPSGGAAVPVRIARGRPTPPVTLYLYRPR